LGVVFENRRGDVAKAVFWLIPPSLLETLVEIIGITSSVFGAPATVPRCPFKIQ